MDRHRSAPPADRQGRFHKFVHVQPDRDSAIGVAHPTIFWYHGTRTHIVTFWAVSEAHRLEIEAVADRKGYERDGEFWTPPTRQTDFFEITRLKGFDLEFGREDEDAPLNLQRLYLTDETRRRLEATPDFTLWELVGYCPVQAEGEVDGLFFISEPGKHSGGSNAAALQAEPEDRAGGTKKNFQARPVWKQATCRMRTQYVAS